MSYRGDESWNFLKIGSFYGKKDQKLFINIHIFFLVLKLKPKNRRGQLRPMDCILLQPNWGVLLTLNSLTAHDSRFSFWKPYFFYNKTRGFVAKKNDFDFNLIKNFLKHQEPFKPPEKNRWYKQCHLSFFFFSNIYFTIWERKKRSDNLVFIS